MTAESLELPKGLEQSVRLTRSELVQEIRLMAALKMFELGKLSSGKAADLADLSRIEFLETCSRYRISPFNYPDDAVEAELAAELRILDELGSQ